MPKRIAIIGLPGSGKSTFATKLGKICNLPVHHLDKYMFEGKTRKSLEDFLTMKKAIIQEESWIIEGCSISTLEMRFARADTVIYFQFSRLLCIWRLCKRLLTFNQDVADTGCLQGINAALIKYTWNFDRDKRGAIEELRKRYPDVEFIIFRTPQDSTSYLKLARCG